MEQHHLGNTQNKLRADDQEPDKVHDIVHKVVTTVMNVCIGGRKHGRLLIGGHTTLIICAR